MINGTKATCLQYDVTTRKVKGGEDCLYLNIFRKRTATARKMDVMVSLFLLVCLPLFRPDTLSNQIMTETIVVAQNNYIECWLQVINKNFYSKIDKHLCLKLCKIKFAHLEQTKSVRKFGKVRSRTVFVDAHLVILQIL